ncbi:MAG: ABC transporter ATP-binding protein [Synergistaceae bacterium]|nr:ABC transporter ATP-binding protein [Synergistota bacterium]NLM70669.1 ABC transporter ATP-binding protein [Synergistaceae bacterium]
MRQATNSAAESAVEMRRITKRFGDFTANDRIDFEVRRGEVHALLGENGAGKSTLMNQLYGLYPPTSGEIFINGEQVHLGSPKNAIDRGVGMVHQHFMLVQPFTVTENIMLGQESTRAFGILDEARALEEVKALSERYGLSVDPHARIQDISVAMQQRVEILKCLYRGAEIIILDEPTAVLTPQEIEFLGMIVRNLTAEGKTVIIITHKLREIKSMADRCTVIRRGIKVGTVDVASHSESDLAEMMVGRSVSFDVDKSRARPGDSVLSLKGVHALNSRGLKALNGISFEVRRGEILAIAGVDGNGQTELVEVLTGLRRVESGSISLLGVEIEGFTPGRRIAMGLAAIPEDRQKRGLVGAFTVAENLILEERTECPFSDRGILNAEVISEHARDLIERFDIRPPREGYLASSLSGGNQQKVILAREITRSPELLIASQPTRGLDVGAIEYVHKRLVQVRNEGKGVLLVSLDLDETLGLADRIAVIFEGRIVAVLDREDADEKKLGLLMAGGEAVHV